MKRALAARAADTYVLASSKKIGTASRFRVLPRREEISGLITDDKPHDPVIEQHGARGRSPGGRIDCGGSDCGAAGRPDTGPAGAPSPPRRSLWLRVRLGYGLVVGGRKAGS